MGFLSTGPNATLQSNDTCEPTVNYKLYIHFSLIPAIFIICLLSLFTKRVHKRQCWNGIPGLLVPVNMLTELKERRVIAVAFGAATGSLIPLMLSEGNYIVGDDGAVSRWVLAISKLFSVFEVGVIYFPIVVCLTFPNEDILASLLGFIYTVPRLGVELCRVIECPIKVAISEDIVLYYGVLLRFPIIICLFYVSVHFLATLSCALFNKLHKNIKFEEFGSPTVQAVASRHDFLHVRNLLSRTIPDQPMPWYKRFIETFRCYEFKKGFKFPLQIIATVVVSTILIYQVEVAYLVIGSRFYHEGQYLIENLPASERFLKKVSKLLAVFGVWIMVSSIVISIYIAFLTVLLMRNYRENVLKIWAGKWKFLPLVLPSPAKLVRLSLRYSGYQFVHIVYGFAIMNFLFLIVGFIVCSLAVFWSYVKPFASVFLDSVLPFFVVFLILWLTQFILAWGVFRDYDYPNLTININNPRLFHIANYFFFFYGFLVGIWGALARVIKSIILNVFMFPRIDHNLLMDGFHSLDNGYMAYLGFLFVSAAHMNPTMHVFCQILLDKSKKKHVANDSQENGYNEIEDARPRVSKKAFNRWFLTLQLMKNPALIQYRKCVRYPQLLVNHQVNT